MDEHDRGPDSGPTLQDAQRRGLTPVVAPGVHFASSLRHERLTHRVIACLCLGAIALSVLIFAGTVLSG